LLIAGTDDPERSFNADRQSLIRSKVAIFNPLIKLKWVFFSMALEIYNFPMKEICLLQFSFAPTPSSGFLRHKYKDEGFRAASLKP